MPDLMDFYRTMYGKAAAEVIADPEVPVDLDHARGEYTAHEKHKGESPARQRKAAAGEDRLTGFDLWCQEAIASQQLLDYQKPGYGNFGPVRK